MTKYERAHILKMQYVYQEQRQVADMLEMKYRWEDQHSLDRFVRSLETDSAEGDVILCDEPAHDGG